MAENKEEKASASPQSSGTTPQGNPLSRKLNRILENRLEDERDTTEALKVLSEFLTTNTLHARRNLRSDLEKRGLTLSKDFRDLLGGLASQVQEMQVSSIIILFIYSVFRVVFVL